MDAKRGYYSLIQYCPDPSRLESVNIGVILFCPEASFIDVRISSSNQRVSKFFGRDSFDKDRINASKQAIENRLHRARSDFKTLEDLQGYLDKLANEVKASTPRPVKVVEPDKELDELFKELVGGTSGSAVQSTSEFRELDMMLRAPALAGKVRFNETLKVPVLGLGFKVPYQYQNGMTNLVRPHLFPVKGDLASEQAGNLAIRGDLIQRHTEPGQLPRKLIVVTAFSQGGEDGVEEHVHEILNEYKVRIVPEEGTSDLIEEIKAEAR